MEHNKDVYIVLLDSETAVVKAIQARKPGDCPTAWKATADNLKVSESYLKAICKISLPASNMIGMSSLERAKRSVNLDWVDEQEVRRKKAYQVVRVGGQGG
jgi:hypothetical protein